MISSTCWNITLVARGRMGWGGWGKDGSRKTNENVLLQAQLKDHGGLD